MIDIENYLANFKAEADEILFEDLHFDSRLKERVRQCWEGGQAPGQAQEPLEAVAQVDATEARASRQAVWRRGKWMLGIAAVVAAVAFSLSSWRVPKPPFELAANSAQSTANSNPAVAGSAGSGTLPAAPATGNVAVPSAGKAAAPAAAPVQPAPVVGSIKQGADSHQDAAVSGSGPGPAPDSGQVPATRNLLPDTAGAAPGGTENAPTGGPSRQETAPPPSQPAQAGPAAPAGEPSLDMKAMPLMQPFQANLTYPAPDAVVAKITYKLTTGLPQVPVTAFAYTVNHPVITEDQVKQLAMRFGLQEPQPVRVNGNSWVMGQGPDGKSITGSRPQGQDTGIWLQVMDSGYVFYDNTLPTLTGIPPAKVSPEQAVQDWLARYGLTAGDISWQRDASTASPQDDGHTTVTWRPTLAGFPVLTSGAQFLVAGDGTIVHAGFPLWQVKQGEQQSLKTAAEALAELQQRAIRLDKVAEHTVTLDKVELIYSDPSGTDQSHTELFYHFAGMDDNNQPFNQYVYARRDKTGPAPWEH